MRFLLIDRIVSLEPGRRIHAVKTLPPDEELFLDHFPGFPVVPGVLLVEMMAQAAGKCIHSGSEDYGVAMLGRINEATFRDWVRPGQLIDVFAEVVSIRPKFATAKGRISVEAEPRASVDLLFGFAPHERFAAGYRDAVLEEFLQRAS